MIRQIEKRDIEAVVSIYNYYIVNTIASFEIEPVSIPDMQSRIDRVLAIGFPWLVAEEDSQIVGYAYACYWNTRPAYRHTAEVTVYLSHSHLSKGWGSLLYSSLFQALTQVAVKEVIGGVSLPNKASVALHEKFGMVKVAHYKKIGRKFDNWVDVAYWQCELDKITL